MVTYSITFSTPGRMIFITDIEADSLEEAMDKFYTDPYGHDNLIFLRKDTEEPHINYVIIDVE